MVIKQVQNNVRGQQRRHGQPPCQSAREINSCAKRQRISGAKVFKPLRPKPRPASAGENQHQQNRPPDIRLFFHCRECYANQRSWQAGLGERQSVKERWASRLVFVGASRGWTRIMEQLFEIVHEDDELLVINKPADLVCHPTKGDVYSSLISRVRLYLGPGAESHLINRLDRETSGLVLVAKKVAVAVELRQLWENRLVQKEYLAIVRGHVAE